MASTVLELGRLGQQLPIHCRECGWQVWQVEMDMMDVMDVIATITYWMWPSMEDGESRGL
jgi:hypothetical protein